MLLLLFLCDRMTKHISFVEDPSSMHVMSWQLHIALMGKYDGPWYRSDMAKLQPFESFAIRKTVVFVHIYSE